MLRLLSRWKRVAAVVLVSGCAAARPPLPAGWESPSASGADGGIVGTWRIAAFEDWDAQGNVYHAYGEHPIGYVIYTPTGQVSVHIQQAPPRTRFSSGVDSVWTPEEIRSQVNGYATYFGTYTVDPAQGIVTHRVEGALRPSYVGTEQRRPFRVSGDTLILGDEKTWRRVFLRVR